MSCSSKKVEEWKIEDPSGKSIEKFREVRNGIKERVEKLVETLKKCGQVIA